ncbi:MAG: CAP domain-containing protein [bacterium]|nr:CAP domain-containing protein [bacterium]
MKKRNIITTLLLSIFFSFTAYAAPIETPFYNSKQSIKIGMQSDSVYFLQIFLADQGLFVRNNISGYFGPLTLKAVKTFQTKSSIESTGLVGPKTKEKIAGLIATSKIIVPPASITLPQPAPLVATTTEIGHALIVTATSSPAVKYVLQPRPNYDLKKLAKDIQILINDKREEFHLNPIYWDEELAGVAEEHSQDQARDNIEITDPDVACHYPMIRHEGFTLRGYFLKDRYSSRNIKYRYGGENIAMIPIVKELLYVQMSNEPVTVCKDVDKYDFESGPEVEKTAMFRTILAQSRAAVKDLIPVQWVNKEWRTDKEIVDMTVDGWMNSLGHRANILTKEFTSAGIGIAVVNDDIIVTHNFVGR